MNENITLREEVGTRCLEKALELLQPKSAPTAETVGMVKALVDAAVEINECNFRWENKIPFGS